MGLRKIDKPESVRCLKIYVSDVFNDSLVYNMTSKKNVKQRRYK